MGIYFVDARCMTSKNTALEYIKSALRLSECCGNTLSSVSDCLHELPQHSIVWLAAYDTIEATLEDYGNSVIQIFKEASQKGLIDLELVPSSVLSNEIEAFVKKMAYVELPNSRITILSMVGEGCPGIEEFNKPGYPPTVRIIFESSFGPDSNIKNALWLPKEWNGELIGQGNGGYGGTLCSQYWTHTLKGFATVETDMGTSRLQNDEISHFSFDMLKDYSWRATHIMTVVAKLLIEQYYGRPPDRSFFTGSSAGGLQAYTEAQRYPEDYDGIFAGVPSNNVLNYHIYNIWLYQKLIKSDGKHRFYCEDAERIHKCAVEFFRKRGDGEEGDDFITFPYIDQNTVDDLILYIKECIPEFAEEQLQALREVYNGPVHAKTGVQLFSGLPIGAEIHCNYMVKDMDYPVCGNKWLDPYFGSGFDLKNFDFADDYDRVFVDLAPYFGANNADLSEFMKRGGKLLSYSGAADRAGPFADTLKYYNRVCEKLGGYEKVSKFFRHFTLPGKAHGNNGRGANVYWGKDETQSILETLRQWCITEVPPKYLTVAHEIKDDESVRYSFIRRVYPYRADLEEGKGFPKSTDEKYLNVQQRE